MFQALKILEEKENGTDCLGQIKERPTKIEVVESKKEEPEEEEKAQPTVRVSKFKQEMMKMKK